MNRRKLSNSKIFTATTLIILTIFTIFAAIPSTVAVSDYEDILIISDLEKKDLTWEVDKSMGIFAQDDIHPHDQYKFYVYSADVSNQKYVVNTSEASWTSGEWEDDAIATDSDYKLIKRDWYDAARSIFAEEDGEYWGSAEELYSKYEIDYKTQFVKGRYVTIVEIKFLINDTNYDIATYTRSEGILISRETKIDCLDEFGEELKGEFKISLTDYSGDFEVSFWYYIIILAIVGGSVLIVLITASIIISKRQNKLKNLEY